MKKKLLIITTASDRSLPLFFTEKIKERLEVEVCLISEKTEVLIRRMKAAKPDYLYLRDPFTDPALKIGEIRERCRAILENTGAAQMIDGLRREEDVLFEDKWWQYGLFSDLMPETKLFRKEDQARRGVLFKERISSRAQGIFFDGRKLPKAPSRYIVQERLIIRKEYRIFILFGQVVETFETKSSKTENGKVRVLGKGKMPARLLRFSEEVARRISFDFTGIDVAETEDGKLYLLEVNRSCLFNAYYHLTGTNLAELFVGELLGQER